MQIAEDKFDHYQPLERDGAAGATSEWKWYHILPLVAAAIYIFTPVLIWQFGLPGIAKFLGDGLVILMIGLAIGRMLLLDRIPGAFLVILALTIVGSIVAAFEGQSGDVTVYGWWMLFRFPMVGLYVYMVPDWPKSIPSQIPKALLIILFVQVVAQVLLYLSGVRDFDNLSGTFGPKGVGSYVYFIILTLCVALGRWLMTGQWKMLATVLVLGSFASALGEMKLFIIAAPILALVALGYHLLHGAKARRIITYILFFSIAATAFLLAYDRIIVQGLGKAPLDVYLNEDNRERYLDYTRAFGNTYQLGRNNEVEYGWQLVQRDTITLLFGYGLGTRQYSPELGLVGRGVEESLYGFYVGRSLLVLMYEMGLLGLIVLLLFAVVSSIILYRSIKRDQNIDRNVLRFGILFFTIFWPLWIWYKAIWIMPAPSILYWMLWGYLMQYSVGDTFHLQREKALIENSVQSKSV